VARVDDGSNVLDQLNSEQNHVPVPWTQSKKMRHTATASTSHTMFPVGTIVDIESRTWPGVNKPGGVARITALNGDGTFNVAYVLGGKETNIEAAYISKACQLANAENGEGAVRIRRRRRPQDDLPDHLLLQLAKEGFDTGISVGKAYQRPRKRSKIGGDLALVDSTNGQFSECPKKSSRRTLTRKRHGTDNVAASIPANIVKRNKPAPQTMISDKCPNENNNSSVMERSCDNSGQENCWSTEESCRMADEAYKARFQRALANKVITVAVSGLKETDLALLKSLCTRSFKDNIKLKMTEAINSKTTLCVISVTSSNTTNIQAKIRSFKVMKSALEGVPMTTPEWLQKCEHSGSIQPPTQYVRTLPTKSSVIEDTGEASYGVSRLSAMLQIEKHALPFNNCFAFLAGNYHVNVRTTLTQLLKAGGATIFFSQLEVSSKLDELGKCNSESESFSSSKVVLLCGDSGVSLSKPLEAKIKAALESDGATKVVVVISHKWVAESITCAKMLPALLFEPRTKKELWRLSIE
jgi:hypothetical protein